MKSFKEVDAYVCVSKKLYVLHCIIFRNLTLPLPLPASLFPLIVPLKSLSHHVGHQQGKEWGRKGRKSEISIEN